jgi:hypothetical protein
MSQRLDRIVTDLDKEIADAEAHLSKLRESRRHAVSARDSSQRGNRSAGPSSSRPAPEELNGSTVPYERIEDALRRIMANGEPWHVKKAHEALAVEGSTVTRASVNAALNRGATPNGPFEKVGHGLYRVRLHPVQPSQEEAAPQ